MRRIINIVLTLAVIGGSLAGGSYLRRISTDIEIRQEISEGVAATDSEPLLAKPEFFAYTDLLRARIVKGSDGLQKYTQVPVVWDSTTLRISAYTSLMLIDNASRGADALTQKDLVDAGILLLRDIVSEPDQLYILKSWTVADTKEVQAFADKYIAMAKLDNYIDISDIKNIANNLYPQWAADRYMQAAAPVYDMSGVKPPNPSSCSLPSIDREALKVEYDRFSAALERKEYNGSVSLPDSTLNMKDTVANMYKSAYSEQLTSINYVTMTVAASYNEKSKAELGYPLLTLNGEHYDDENYRKITSIIGALYEANIHLNSYSSLGIVGSPLDVHALETNNPTLEVTTNPSYMSEHALYWTIARGYLEHYGLKFKAAAATDYLNSPLLKGKGPERFGEGVLYWSAGIDASIVLGECLVKHHLETGI